jgi:hypothetical protein
MYDFGLNKQLSDLLLKRCRDLKMSVECRRKTVMSASNTTAYTYKDTRVGYIVDERFKFNLTPLVGPVAPPHLDDDFLRTTIIMFGGFSRAIGLAINKTEDMWTTKAAQVTGLETFLRENLAVNSQSFCFLEEEILYNENTRRLTNHEIWWKKESAESFEKMPWPKLIQQREYPLCGHLYRHKDQIDQQCTSKQFVWPEVEQSLHTWKGMR